MKTPPAPSRGTISLRMLAGMVIAFLLPTLLLFADPPGWWAARGVTNGNGGNDYAAVNQGQLKKMVTAAFQELSAHLPGGVGDMTAPSGTFPGGTGYRLTALINSWSTVTSGTLVETTGSNTNDYAAVNLGQLKTVAGLFYNRLIEVGYSSQYPWLSSTNTPNDYAAANIGQVKNLFSFDVTYDSDGNGLPDWWELYYFGAIGQSGTAAAPSGNGLTVLQSYQDGVSPIDFYNGVSPTLTIVSGTNQTGAPGALLSSALVVQVTGTSGAPIVNAPVTFEVTTGAGVLAPDNSGTSATSSSLEAITGTDGRAQIWFQQPNDASFTSTVAAYAEASEVDFTSTSSADTNSPAAPTNVSATINDDGSILVTWTDNSDNETGFTIQISNDGGSTWTTVGTTGPDTGSILIPAGQSVTAGTTLVNCIANGADGNNTSAAAPSTTLQTIPTFNYLPIDISGTNITTDVQGVSMDDTCKVAYCFASGTSGNAVTVNSWVSGTTATVQTITTDSPQYNIDQPAGNIDYFFPTRTEVFGSYNCTPSGILFGKMIELMGDGSFNIDGAVGEGFIGAGGTKTLRDLPNPPFHTSYATALSSTEIIPIQNLVDEGSAGSISGSNAAGYYGVGSGLYCDDTINGISYPASAAFITGSTATTIFSGSNENWYATLNGFGSLLDANGNPINLVKSWFHPIAMNDVGAAIGSSDSLATGACFWSGTNMISLGTNSVGIALNKQNMVIGTAATAMLWLPLVTSGSSSYPLQSLVSGSYKNEINILTPLAISNANASNRVWIVCKAQLKDSSGIWNPADVLLYLNANNPAQNPYIFMAIPPAGIVLDSMLQSINQYGVIAAIGDPQSTGVNHALILIPGQFTIRSIQNETGPGIFQESGTGKIPNDQPWNVYAWDIDADIEMSYIPGITTQIQTGMLRDLNYVSEKKVSGLNYANRYYSPIDTIVKSINDIVPPLWLDGFLPDRWSSTVAPNSPLPHMLPLYLKPNGLYGRSLASDQPSLSLSNPQVQNLILVSDKVYGRCYFYLQYGNSDPVLVAQINFNYYNEFGPDTTNGVRTIVQQKSSYVNPPLGAGNIFYGQLPDTATPPAKHNDISIKSEANRYLDQMW